MDSVGRPALGTLPSQGILELLKAGVIETASRIEPGQIQPASLDLTIAADAWSMPGSVLPLVGERVADVVESYARRSIDLSSPTILERGQVYVVALNERVRLTDDLAAYANGKSSIGRIDVQTRVLADGNPRYDKLPSGYRGPLYLEIIPKSFDLRLRAGDSLNQIIFYSGRTMLSHAELRALHDLQPILHEPSASAVGSADGTHGLFASGGVLMTLDLDQPTVGWVAKKSYRPIDLAQLGHHDPLDYFDPIPRPKDAALFLSREAFYIFSTAERVVVPPDFAVEMLPYDTSAGEFRAHYAGFFDPGFGWGEGGEMGGAPAVLEVRPYEDDLLVRHRQPVCKMVFERLVSPPDLIYGAAGSHYAHQRGPRLSKFFRDTPC